MENHLRYMAAHVRLNAAATIREWTAEDIMDSYLLLAPPRISFLAWQQAISGGDVEVATEPDQADMTDDEIAARNRAGLNVLKLMQHPAIKIEESKSDAGRSAAAG